MTAAYLLLTLHAEAGSQPDTPQHQLKAWSEGSKPLFALSDLEGRQRELAPVGDGIVLVHFFATWCEPCREELASLRALVDARAVAMTVIAVNVGEVRSRVSRFLEGTTPNFPVVLDADRAVTRAWNVHALPTTFVLDRSLAPRLFVEGDLDWMKGEVIAALNRVAADTADDDAKDSNREESR